MRLPGFRREIRPGHDVREFLHYLSELTATRVGHIVVSLGVIVGGVREVGRDHWWGAFIACAGLVALVAPAWFFYYGVPESTGPSRGKRTP